MEVTRLRSGLRNAACALALLAVAPGILAQRPHSTAADNPQWTTASKGKLLESISKLVLNAAYVPNIDFNKWNTAITAMKPELDKAKNEEEFAGVINAELRDTFHISHIVLMPPRAVEQRVTQQMVGIGIRINVTDEGVLVTSTVPGAPAEKAGIEPGDLIMEADGHKADGPTYITGPEGTSVNLKVKKAESKEIKMISVKRAKFNTRQPETLTWVNSDTAVIKIPTYDLAYDRNNVEKLMKDASSAKNLIVDLRNNGGGAVLNMMHFMSMVIPTGKEIGTFVNKQMVNDFVEKEKGNPNDLAGIAKFSSQKISVPPNRSVDTFKGHVAVLVNAGSGSASEITAQALKEVLNAPVVGKRSAGAVLVSVMGPLPFGFSLQYPISDYVSINGVRLEANGIKPDAESNDVTIVKKGETDPAFKLAEGLIQKAANGGGN